MAARGKILALVVLALVSQYSRPWTAERLKFATSTKDYPLHILPVMAALEKGFFKGQGLEADWMPSEQAGPMFQAVAGGHIDMGIGAPSSAISAAARGVPVVIVAEVGTTEDYYLWARTESPIRGPQDLKGTRLGITRYGGLIHAYGVVSTKALGLEQDIKLVAAGGTRHAIAALRAGVVDTIVLSGASMLPLKYRGEVKEVVRVTDFLPKNWIHVTLFARKEFWQRKPEVVRSTIKAMLQSAAFIARDADWTTKKLVDFNAYPEEGARAFYRTFTTYSKDGKVEATALENVTTFLIQYRLITREKAPSVNELLPREFAR